MKLCRIASAFSFAMTRCIWPMVDRFGEILEYLRFFETKMFGGFEPGG